MDAQRAGGSPRPAALPQTQTDGRAAVRQHQTQQRLLPLPPTRQDQGAPRVATTDDDPQPHQDSPPPARDDGGLNGPHGITPPLMTDTLPTARRPLRATVRAFERQPPSGARTSSASLGTPAFAIGAGVTVSVDAPDRHTRSGVLALPLRGPAA